MDPKLLPLGLGYRGTIAVLEASATEYNTIIDMVRKALAVHLYPTEKHPWVSLEAIYSDEAIIRHQGKLFSFAYSLNDNNQVQLGQGKEVVKNYTPVKATNVTEAVADGLLMDVIEAKGTSKGTRWLVRVVEAGLSKNSNNYPASVLKTATPLFNGVQVYQKSDAEHLAKKGKDFKNLIGGLSNAQFVEAANGEPAQIIATLNVLESTGTAKKMLELHTRNMSDLFGFSIDAMVKAKYVKLGGKRVVEATKFNKVNSLDLIIEPGAGGSVINVLEATEDNTMLKQLLEALEKKRKDLLENLDRENETQVLEAYNTMIADEAGSDNGKGATSAENTAGGQQQVTEAAAGDTGTEGQVDMTQAIRMLEARQAARTVIIGSGLPQVSQTRLIAAIEKDLNVTEATAQEMVTTEKDYLASVSGSGRVSMGAVGNLNNGASDGSTQMLEAFFDPEDKTVVSVRECYLACTGDDDFTGRLTTSVSSRLLEALDTTSLANAFGEAMHKRMMDLYKVSTVYDAWKLLVDIVPVSDFRNQERTSLGGYGDLSAVAESGNYPAMSALTDGKENYAVSKRGGIETITLEMIANDDVGVIQRIPGKMVRAAKRTLAKFVFDMFVSNPLMNDGNNVFHASRNNLGTAALGDAGIAAARLHFMKALEPGSNEELGLVLKNLLVPADLEQAAYDLFKRDTNNDESFIQSLKPNIIPIPGWTDPNDWVATVDKADQPLIELGFFRGREEPELFVQDAETHGSMFANDEITYKIRHIYGGAFLSSLGAYKNVVV
jgi:hypothetical protein